jgi:2-polyprenyl-6-methoxyphenol hydroxylase-like FAD-dependent oxidoreductase
MASLKIRIVGGSLSGLFAAALLSKAGHDVKLYERSVNGFDGRGAGLVGQPELFAILKTMGCEHVANVGVLATEQITLDRTGAITKRVATSSMEISWDRLYRIFREFLPEGAYMLGTEVEDVGQDDAGAYLTMRNGTKDSADVVIGADGVGSVVREPVTALPSQSVYAGYIGWRGLFPEIALPSEAKEVLLERFAFYRMPHSHVIGYVVAGPNGETERGARRYNWVWYRLAPGETGKDSVLTDLAGVVHQFSLPPGLVSEQARDRLIEDANQMLPPAFAAAIAAETRPFVQAIFDYEAPQMSRGRIALLCDAAFTVRPHTAMGAAKAAGDALALEKHLRQKPLLQALRDYRSEREPVGAAIAAHGRELGARFK